MDMFSNDKCTNKANIFQMINSLTKWLFFQMINLLTNEENSTKTNTVQIGV